jgi:MYXO-CTERM domain-containing protein
VRCLVAALVLLLGLAALVHGEADDSPGLQLVGAALVVAAVVIAVRARRRRRTS